LGGDAPTVRVLMEENGGNNAVAHFAGDGITDLKGVLLNVADSSRLKGLEVIGDDVRDFWVREPRRGHGHGHGHGNGHGWNWGWDWDWDWSWKDRDRDRDWDKHDWDHDRDWDKHAWHRGSDDRGHDKHGDKHRGGDDSLFGKNRKLSHDIVIALGTSCIEDELLETSYVFMGEKFTLLVKGLRDGECEDDECDPEVIRLVTNVPVPEPSTALLVALGIGSIGYLSRSWRSR
jgi:hypothetical protein